MSSEDGQVYISQQQQPMVCHGCGKQKSFDPEDYSLKLKDIMTRDEFAQAIDRINQDVSDQTQCRRCTATTCCFIPLIGWVVNTVCCSQMVHQKRVAAVKAAAKNESKRWDERGVQFKAANPLGVPSAYDSLLIEFSRRNAPPRQK